MEASSNSTSKVDKFIQQKINQCDQDFFSVAEEQVQKIYSFFLLLTDEVTDISLPLIELGKGVKERSVTAAGLLEQGADIDTRNRYGQTALHLALAHFSSFCHITPKQFFKSWVDLMAQWIMFLLDHGSDLSLHDVNFNTPFHYCRLIYNHRFDQWLPLVQELLTLGIEKYLNANNKAAAVLQISNDSGLYPVVLTLFQEHYDEKPCIVCSARDVHNDSPLCLNNSFGTEFLKCEYDKKWQNVEGQSLMHFYALNYRDILHESTVKSLQVFVQTGGDPRQVDKLGRNCLHYNTEFLRALVKVDMPAQLGNVVHDLFTARDVLDRTPIYYINFEYSGLREKTKAVIKFCDEYFNYMVANDPKSGESIAKTTICTILSSRDTFNQPALRQQGMSDCVLDCLERASGLYSTDSDIPSKRSKQSLSVFTRCEKPGETSEKLDSSEATQPSNFDKMDEVLLQLVRSPTQASCEITHQDHAMASLARACSSMTTNIPREIYNDHKRMVTEQSVYYFKVVEKRVTSLMTKLAEHISNKHALFAAKPVLVGSAREGTKLGKPDEFDFNFELYEFSKLLTAEMSSYPGYAHLKSSTDNISQFLAAQYFDPMGYLRPNYVFNKWQAILSEAILDGSFIASELESDPDIKAELVYDRHNYKHSRYENIDYSPLLYEKVLVTHVACNFNIILHWKNGEREPLTVAVDATPCIVSDHPPLHMQSGDLPMDRFVYVFDEPYRVCPWILITKPYVRLSSSQAECESILNSCQAAKDAYILAKRLIQPDHARLSSATRYAYKTLMWLVGQNNCEIESDDLDAEQAKFRSGNGNVSREEDTEERDEGNKTGGNLPTDGKDCNNMKNDESEAEEDQSRSEYNETTNEDAVEEEYDYDTDEDYSDDEDESMVHFDLETAVCYLYYLQLRELPNWNDEYIASILASLSGNLSAYALKMSFIHCLKASKANSSDSQVVESNDVMYWLNRIFRCVLGIALLDYVPNYFIPNFYRPIFECEKSVNELKESMAECKLSYRQLFSVREIDNFEDNDCYRIHRNYMYVHALYWLTLSAEEKQSLRVYYPLLTDDLNQSVWRDFDQKPLHELFESELLLDRNA